MSWLKPFLNKHLVIVVMVPSLIGIHWGWYQLHQNEALVPLHQRRDIPIMVAANKLWEKVTGGDSPPPEDKK